MSKFLDGLKTGASKFLVGAASILSPTATKIVTEIYNAAEEDRQRKIDMFNAPRYTGVVTKADIFGDMAGTTQQTTPATTPLTRDSLAAEGARAVADINRAAATNRHNTNSFKPS